MNSNPSQLASEPAETACGGTLQNTDGCPRAIYQGKLVYFAPSPVYRLSNSILMTSCLERSTIP